MENGKVIEYRALCNDCKWHGRKYGNIKNAEQEAAFHVATFKHEDVEVSESQVNNDHPMMGEYEAKLLFIRQSAQKAYEENNIPEATKDIMKLVLETSIVTSMTKEEIGQHIGNLEKARSFLAAFTQGIQIGHAKEQEPIFRAKREKEKQDKLADKIKSSSKDKKVNDLIELARRLAEGPLEVKPPKPVILATKQVCEKCKAEVFSLKYHTC